MYTRKEPTYESGTTQACGRTPLQANTNSFLFILHRCQRLTVSESSFPNALCVLLLCHDDSCSSCSIAVLFVASLFHCSLLLSFFLFMLSRCQTPFLSLFFPQLLASFFLILYKADLRKPGQNNPEASNLQSERHLTYHVCPYVFMTARD